MSHIVHDLIARGDARVVEQPAPAPAPVAVRHQVEADRNFGLPTALYGATIACYLGFLVIVGSAFANPVLAIPMAIIVLLIVAAFGVPAIWTRLQGNMSAPETLGEFETRGIMTNTGRLSASEATTQVLILPVLLVAWGLAVAVIAAIVA
jgi:ABC-type dipeptide/oligopeptide/nickel transport system permease subunit